MNLAYKCPECAKAMMYITEKMADGRLRFQCPFCPCTRTENVDDEFRKKHSNTPPIATVN